MKPSYRRNTLNLKRAIWAKDGIDTYAHAIGLDTADGNATVVGNFICDLMHYCQQNKINFAGCLQDGRMHFEAEIGGWE